MRGQHQPSPTVDGVLDGGQALSNTCGIGHTAGRGPRNIEVQADEDPPALNVQIGDGLGRHGRDRFYTEWALVSRPLDDFHGNPERVRFALRPPTRLLLPARFARPRHALPRWFAAGEAGGLPTRPGGWARQKKRGPWGPQTTTYVKPNAR